MAFDPIESQTDGVVGQNAQTSLNGLFKEIYNQLKDLVPANTKLADMIPFAPGDKELGAAYNEPVVLGLEGGVTYGGSDGEAFALRTPSSFTLRNARVKSVEMVLRSAISTAVASRSQNSNGAFERGIKLLTGNMMKSMYHRLEVSMLYGQQGIGVVESASLDAGNTVVKIKDQEWAAGIWVGTTKHKVDVFASDLMGGAIASEISIVGYDIEAKTITLSGDLTASLAANQQIFFSGAYAGAGSHKDMLGLHKIAVERQSLFEIANAAEPLFQGNIVDVGTVSAAAVLSFAKVEEAVARAVEKGLGEEQMTVMVNVNSWNDLLTEQTAKRRYTSDYSSKVKEGSRAIEFEGQAGSIKIIPSTYVKEGYAYAFCEKDLIRIGSSDITFDPKGYEGEFFRLLDNHSGYEIRAYSDQALFSSRPSCITVLRYIKNPTHP